MNFYQLITGKNKQVAATPEISAQVDHALVNYVYQQANAGILTSLFCGSVIYIALYNSKNSLLLIWYVSFLAITIMRLFLTKIYFAQPLTTRHLPIWHYLFVSGVVLGGCCWGFIGAILFPLTGSMQQTLSILILAGITASAVPSLSAILSAAVTFLILAILPFIIDMMTINQPIYELFDLTLSAYLIYLIVLAIKSHSLVRSVMTLELENEKLLSFLLNANQQLESLATHDALTKVPNARFFHQHTPNLIRHCLVNKRSFALLYIDLDKFKPVNDEHGHLIGDELLLIVAQRIKQVLRNTDFLARLGGDEFAVIIDDLKEQHDLSTVAQKICLAISTPISINSLTLHVTASVGIGIYPDDGKDISSLIRAADQAMYYVKKHGQNNYHFSSNTPYL